MSKKRYAAPAVEVLAVRLGRLMAITGSIDPVPWGAKGYGGDLEDDEEEASASE